MRDRVHTRRRHGVKPARRYSVYNRPIRLGYYLGNIQPRDRRLEREPTHRRLICISARLIVNGPPRRYVAVTRSLPTSCRLAGVPSLQLSRTRIYAATIEIDNRCRAGPPGRLASLRLGAIPAEATRQIARPLFVKHLHAKVYELLTAPSTFVYIIKCASFM